MEQQSINSGSYATIDNDCAIALQCVLDEKCASKFHPASFQTRAQVLAVCVNRTVS